MNSFLASSRYIDWRDVGVSQLSAELLQESANKNDFVRRAFEWVRDEIRHTGDFKLDVVTCAASEVLHHRTGYCYAKSHLLAALCRAQGVPAGLGYQRLSMNDDGPPFCLHGFAVIELEGHGWRRLDPRGNKPGIATQFSESIDCLAFTPSLPGEMTFAEILPEPLEVVVEAMRKFPRRNEFSLNLPDSACILAVP
jgi:transglutaminase-like putative cysteine protease